MFERPRAPERSRWRRLLFCGRPSSCVARFGEVALAKVRVSQRPSSLRLAPAALAVARPPPPSFAGGADPSFVLGFCGSLSRTRVVLGREPQKSRKHGDLAPSRGAAEAQGAADERQRGPRGRHMHQERAPRCTTRTSSLNHREKGARRTTHALLCNDIGGLSQNTRSIARLQ